MASYFFREMKGDPPLYFTDKLTETPQSWNTLPEFVQVFGGRAGV
jgi:hypothetical protein